MLTLGLICALWIPDKSAWAVTTVRLRTAAAIDSENLLLGDIAAIESEDAQLAETLRQVQVASLALPGQTRLIYPGQVQLSLNRFKAQGDDSIRLEAAGPVKVTRNYLEISEKEIEKAIRNYIDQHAPWDRSQMKVGPASCPADVRVPNGKVDFKVTAPRHTDWLGQVTFSVRIHVDKNPARKINVTVPIQVWREVVLTAKPMVRGEPIDPDDLKVVAMDLAKAPVNAILDPADALGGFAGKAIAANTILRKDLVRIPPLVRKGDVVRVVAHSDGLTVSTNGLVKEDGVKGDRIRLINLSSSKTIYARVVEAGTVQVDF